MAERRVGVVTIGELRVREVVPRLFEDDEQFLGAKAMLARGITCLAKTIRDSFFQPAPAVEIVEDSVQDDLRQVANMGVRVGLTGHRFHAVTRSDVRKFRRADPPIAVLDRGCFPRELVESLRV